MNSALFIYISKCLMDIYNSHLFVLQLWKTYLGIIPFLKVVECTTVIDFNIVRMIDWKCNGHATSLFFLFCHYYISILTILLLNSRIPYNVFDFTKNKNDNKNWRKLLFLGEAFMWVYRIKIYCKHTYSSKKELFYKLQNQILEHLNWRSMSFI